MARGTARFRWGLVVCAAGAAVVRLAVYLRYYRGAPFGFNDAPYYSQTATALAHGHWFVLDGQPAAEHGPITTLLVAPVSWTDSPEDWQRLVTVVTGVAAVVVVGLVGRRLGGERVGLVAAALAALYPGLWLNDGLVMAESPGALAVVVWMLAALVWQERRTPVWAALMGLAAGVAMLTRAELGVLMVAGVIATWWLGGDRRRLMAVLAAVGGLLVLAPWVAFNLGRFDRPVVLTTNDGTTLRASNCDAAYEGRAIGSAVIKCLVIDPEVVGMETSQRSARWRADGIEYARDHAGRVPVVVLARLGRSLDLFGLGYQVEEDVREGRPRPGSWAAIFSFWALAALGLVGQRRATAFGRFVLWSPVVAVVLTAVAFYGSHRVRAALEPSVVLGAALAVVALAERWLGSRSGPAADADAAPPASPEPEATSALSPT